MDESSPRQVGPAERSQAEIGADEACVGKVAILEIQSLQVQVVVGLSSPALGRGQLPELRIGQVSPVNPSTIQLACVLPVGASQDGAS